MQGGPQFARLLSPTDAARKVLARLVRTLPFLADVPRNTTALPGFLTHAATVGIPTRDYRAIFACDQETTELNSLILYGFVSRFLSFLYLQNSASMHPIALLSNKTSP